MFIGFYNFSVVLTYIGLASAVVGMYRAMHGSFKVAFFCLLICGACDMFDGKIARAMKRTEDAKLFGIQIDSLCDLVCFGVFPAVIGYGIGVRSVFGIVASIAYVLAAIIRLGYFNVMEEKRQQETTEVRKYYQGLPVTSSAVLFPMMYLCAGLLKGPLILVYEITLLVMALLFILNLKVKKPTNRAITAIVLFAAILIFLYIKYL